MAVSKQGDASADPWPPRKGAESVQDVIQIAPGAVSGLHLKGTAFGMKAANVLMRRSHPGIYGPQRCIKDAV